MPSLKQINAQAGTRFKRWKELTDAVTLPWHPQIHRPTAEKAGLTPADFTWLDYPVSNVRIRANESRHVDLDYLADLPPNTPQLNFYIRNEERHPRKSYDAVQFGDEVWYTETVVGTALASMVFTLKDEADGETLHESGGPNHLDGVVQSGLSASATGIKLWERLTPGGSIRVRLEAYPRFFPYNKDGDGGNHYNVGGRGYCWGETASSPVYILTADDDYNLSITEE